MSKQRSDEWLRDLEARQQNAVFPDTVRNEGEFYRGIVGHPLTRAGKVGLALLAAFVVIPLAIVIRAVIVTSAQMYPIRAVRTGSILLTLGVIGGGTALFILVLYLTLRHGVEKFAGQHRGRFRRS